ncbi:c-type cytochrome [Crenobacter cavernae]|uniref:Cytochrome c5 family protein n=1 Tax=Crenobacter cavernae TaxID=2290923 RepID=A0ABY0FER2_9NEIS|nr:c-type cytochrome [Crenobacter cavernae]RXZ44785.1 cytochrome c5 family protein [Crenobacter cavernae]
MSNENQAASAPLKAVVGIIVFLAVAIYLLAKLATSGFQIDAQVMTKEAVASRLKPAGSSVASDAPPGQRTGEQVYTAVCLSCHGTGLAGSPKFGDAGAWGARIAQGFDTLSKHALEGFKAMPAKGGSPDLSDDEVKRAVAYMGNAGGAKFTEPAVGGAAGGAAALPDPDTVGKKIYESICVACHASGAAGAPKFGDKAAWAPRLKDGVDAVFNNAKKGLNAMPPKGGYTGSDEEFHAAVIYLTNAAK